MKHNRNIGVTLVSLILFTLACNLPGRVAEEVGEQIEQKIDEIDFPPEYQYQITGEEQKRKEGLRIWGFERE